MPAVDVQAKLSLRFQEECMQQALLCIANFASRAFRLRLVDCHRACQWDRGRRGGDTSRTFPPAQAPTRPRSSRRRAAAAAASHTAGAAPTHPVLLPATLAPSPHVHWRASPFLAQSLTTPPTALTGPVALPHVQPQRSSQRTRPPGSGLAPSSYR